VVVVMVVVVAGRGKEPRQERLSGMEADQLLVSFLKRRCSWECSQQEAAMGDQAGMMDEEPDEPD
jgi:hypothetical protein